MPQTPSHWSETAENHFLWVKLCFINNTDKNDFVVKYILQKNKCNFYIK